MTLIIKGAGLTIYDVEARLSTNVKKKIGGWISYEEDTSVCWSCSRSWNVFVNLEKTQILETLINT